MSTPDDSNTQPPAGENSSISGSLLLRVRDRQPDAWQRLDHLYSPLVLGWCRKAGLSAEDAEDVRQETFRAVDRSIDRFRRKQPGDSFRGWLYSIARFKIADAWRARAQREVARGGSEAHVDVQQLADQLDQDVSSMAADDRHLFLQRALDLIRVEFRDSTWEAFWMVAMQDRTAQETADALGLSRGAVYIAKSRVMSRLREELSELEELPV